MTETAESETCKVMTIPVLATPEILEMILLQTDMRTLLTSAQRVCKGWLNLIKSLPSIQKVLFFTPIEESEWGTNERTLNPLLAEFFSPIFAPKNGSKDHKFEFSDLHWTKDPSSMDRFIRKDASWRRMLVQQPPPSELGLLTLFQASRGDTAKCSTIPAHKKSETPKAKGLRMSRLFEVLLFKPEVQFSTGTAVRVYSSTEEPLEFNTSHGNIKDEFHRMLGHSGIVLCIRKVMKCTIGLYIFVSRSEDTRCKIIKTYGRHGFAIKASIRQMYRRNREREPWTEWQEEWEFEGEEEEEEEEEEGTPTIILGH